MHTIAPETWVLLVRLGLLCGGVVLFVRLRLWRWVARWVRSRG